MSISFPIPDPALDDRLGIVGTAGSGKTYLALTLVERLLSRGVSRVILIDPLDVAWGLRILENGKRSPFNIVILGGEHGDLPLNEHSGSLIGETVAKSAESFVISFGSLGTKASERRFALAFLTSLYRYVSGERLHLVIDEADMLAPQFVRDKEGDAAKLLGMMETIVRRGRVKGFVPYLITQRPAAISKDVLSQVDGLIALKLTSSQDRDAIGAWIEGQADKQHGKAILASLPTMQRGQGVVWIPGRNILETVTFPKKQTFDSSAAPKPGEHRHTAPLPPLDLTALRQQLSAVAKEAEQNDPAKLRKKVSELEARIAKVQTADPAELERQRREGYRRGEQSALDKLRAFHGAAERLAADIAATIRVFENPEGKTMPTPKDFVPQADLADALNSALSEREPSTSIRYLGLPPLKIENNGAAMGRAHRAILTAIVQFPASTPDKIGIIAGYSSSSGHFNNILGVLRSNGWIEHGQPLRPTSVGIKALGAYEPLPTGFALVDYWMNKLGKAERAIFQVVVNAYPHSVDRARLGTESGYSESSGHFNNCLGKLRTLELISRGQQVRAADALFA